MSTGSASLGLAICGTSGGANSRSMETVAGISTTHAPRDPQAEFGGDVQIGDLADRVGQQCFARRGLAQVLGQRQAPS